MWHRANGKRHPTPIQRANSGAVQRPAKPPMSGPHRGCPERPRFTAIGTLHPRCSQELTLSPVQHAALRCVPTNPARVSTNGRRALPSAAATPSRVACTIRCPYTLWNSACTPGPPSAASASCRARTSAVFSTPRNTAGSFMSFHTPSASVSAWKRATRDAHHRRTRAAVKSGNTHAPGHTSPRNASSPFVLPSPFPPPAGAGARIHARIASPSSNTSHPGSALIPGSSIQMPLAPRACSARLSVRASPNPCSSTVKLLNPRM